MPAGNLGPRLPRRYRPRRDDALDRVERRPDRRGTNHAVPGRPAARHDAANAERLPAAAPAGVAPGAVAIVVGVAGGAIVAIGPRDGAAASDVLPNGGAGSRDAVGSAERARARLAVAARDAARRRHAISRVHAGPLAPLQPQLDLRKRPRVARPRPFAFARPGGV
ncbi:hypothetical protein CAUPRSCDRAFT_12814 [Caulochytrium protostelioides]|uniref:Uncharacterized protein n=1 Tax=Caulochytrium protostelioides TaxID=1555241 RepID=A0A4P9WR11_9FUNG|nr:hypothetical protein CAUPRSCDRAFT_12814 [Caulochytrium protostelioides]